MTPVFTIDLPLPPPLSALTKNVSRHGRAATKEYKSWKAEAAVQFWRKGRIELITSPVAVEYCIPTWPTKRRQDIANREKALSDALVDNGVLKDDCLIEKMLLVLHHVACAETSHPSHDGVSVSVFCLPSR